MASIAEQLIAGAEQQAQQAPDIQGSIMQGIGLAQHIEQVQNQRAALEQKKQELQQEKIQKFASLYETAAKLPSGKVRNNFVSNIIPKTRDALGLKDYFPDDSMQVMNDEPALPAYLIQKAQRDPNFYPELLANAKNPQWLADQVPEALKNSAQQDISSLLEENQKPLSDANKFALQQEAQQKRAETLAGPRQGAVDVSKERLDQQIHQNVLTKLQSDRTLRERIVQYQNLDNALATVTKAKHLTPQQIFEFQQAVRSNLGIKGSGGVDERAETFIKTAGLNAANWKQFLTGTPESLAKDSKLVSHLQDLAKVEQGNINNQLSSRMEAITQGHGDLYKKRPDLKKELDSALYSYKKSVVPRKISPQDLSVIQKAYKNAKDKEAFLNDYMNHEGISHDEAVQDLEGQ